MLTITQAIVIAKEISISISITIVIATTTTTTITMVITVTIMIAYFKLKNALKIRPPPTFSLKLVFPPISIYHTYQL